MKLFHQLLLIAAVLALLPLGSGALFSLRAAEEHLSRTALEHQAENARHAASRIGRYLQDVEERAQGLLYRRDLAALPETERAELLGFLVEEGRSFDALALVAPGGGIEAQAYDRLRVGPEDHAVFLRQVGDLTGRPLPRLSYSTPFYSAARGFSLIVLAVPRGEGGALVAEVSLAPLAALIAGAVTDAEAAGLARSGFVVDAAGRIVAHADPRLAEGLPDASAVPAVARALRTAEAGHLAYLDAQGVAVLGSFHPVGVAGLRVVMEQTEEAVYGAVRRMRAITRTALAGGLVLALGLSLFFAARLARPIQTLVEGARAFGTGELERRIPPLAGQELGALGRSFNEMAQALKDLLAERVEGARMEAELRTAEAVQRTLFPRQDPGLSELALAGHFACATETGGDWYGYLHDPEGRRFTVLIGDVTGHGVSAALVTAAAHSFCRSLDLLRDAVHASQAFGEHLSARMHELPPALRELLEILRQDPFAPGALLAGLNRVIRQAGGGNLLMTFFAATVDLESGELIYANAGHEFPLLLRPSGFADGRRLRSLAAPGLRLGDDPQACFAEQALRLLPGDLLLFFTDGVSEYAGPDGQPWGEKRLRRWFERQGAAQTDATTLRAGLKTELETYGRGATQRDDVTFVFMQALGFPRQGRTVDQSGLDPSVAASVSCCLKETGCKPMETTAVPDIRVGPWAGEAGALQPDVVFDASIWEILADPAAERPLSVIGRGPGDQPDLSALRLYLDHRVGTRRRGLRAILSDDRIRSWRLSGSQERTAVRAEVADWARSQGARDWVLEALDLALDEMLLNAFYHAPRAAGDLPRHADRPRYQSVDLECGERVRVASGVQHGRLCLSVRDPFGALTPQVAWGHLRRAAQLGMTKRERPGAGLGIYMLLRAAQGLYLDVDPGRSTEWTLVLHHEERRQRATVERPTLLFLPARPVASESA